MKKPDVLIGGAGIIGCALALRLAEEKLSVLVVDKGRPGEEASWAAAGMLAPTSEHAHAEAEAELCAASARFYPAWIDKLEGRIQEPLGYRREGTLLVAFSQEEAAALDALPGEALAARAARNASVAPPGRRMRGKGWPRWSRSTARNTSLLRGSSVRARSAASAAGSWSPCACSRRATFK